MSMASALRSMAAMACLAGSAIGDDQAVKSTSPNPASEIITQLRAEAARLETGRASDLFANLTDPDRAAWLNLSDTQAGLISRLDKVARDVQRAWLIRGFDRQPPPSAA